VERFPPGWPCLSRFHAHGVTGFRGFSFFSWLGMRDERWVEFVEKGMRDRRSAVYRRFCISLQADLRLVGLRKVAANGRLRKARTSDKVASTQFRDSAGLSGMEKVHRGRVPELHLRLNADPGTERCRPSLRQEVAWDRADARFGTTLDGSGRLAGTRAYLKLRAEPDRRLTCGAAALIPQIKNTRTQALGGVPPKIERLRTS